MNQSRLHRPNISEDLCRIIRKKIVNGGFPAGGHVNEVHLAEELAVSRTPLREAMSQLAAEGLLRSEPRRGFFTPEFSVEEIEQLYPLRAFLDPKALRLAGKLSKRRIADLRRINDKIARAGQQAERAVDLDDQWHRTLLRDCPNKILLQIIDQLIWRTRRYEYAYLSESANLSVATDEHEAILVALEQANMGAACRLLKVNMGSAEKPLIEWLQQLEKSS